MGQITARGWAGQQSAVSEPLHCASPVYLGFYSSLSLSLLLLLLLVYLVQLFNCSYFNPCFLLFFNFLPYLTERNGVVSEQLRGILLPAGG